MTDTTTLDSAPQDAAEKPRRSSALSTMRLAELQGLAASMGITGTAKMRKGDLVTAIKARQSGSAPAAAPTTAPPQRAEQVERAERLTEQAPAQREATQDRQPRPDRGAQQDRGGQQDRQEARGDRQDRQDRQEARGERQDRQDRQDRQERQERGGQGSGPQDREDRDGPGSREDEQGPDRQESRADRQDNRRDRAEYRGEGRELGNRQDARGGDTRQSRGDRQDTRQDTRQDVRQDRQDRQDNRFAENRQDNRGPVDNRGPLEDDTDGRGRRRSRNRSRSRDKRRGGREGMGDFEPEPQVSEDDVLVPVAGILDVLDNYAFVRTSGYLPGANDVYVPLGMVKKNGMRKGDAVTGAVKAQNEDQQQSSRQKFNALVRLDTINGMTPEDAKKRVEFGKLTPLYPQQRLRLETEPQLLTTRIIDLVAPIGKGQRGLIVAPAKAGKTMVMQALANAITTNNPECHLMVVLVDERPEEVTDMQRAVKGEVISSTFDRPAEDHTTVAELAIERAKRLVEMGHDVVVLLDSITKLGRAYNLSAPPSGRILSGGVDSAALYPPKKFFGAARNIEDGGSLTILATALVETGSRMDEVIFEEFKGTGNMELKLDRGLANRRIFPAVDINASGTRREEILLSNEELKIMWKLRRVLAALDQQQGIELLIDRLKKTKSNVEFLMQVQQTSSIKLDDEGRD